MKRFLSVILSLLLILSCASFSFAEEAAAPLSAEEISAMIENGTLDTAKAKAFRVPAGVLVEVYATTLHYAPCSGAPGQGFRVLVALPRGTNGPKPEITPVNEEDKTLWACNKWLLAHPESSEAAQGAPVLLTGENIDIAADL